MYEPEFSDLVVIDFSDLAQGCKTYPEFCEKMENADESELRYYGIAVCGAKESQQTDRKHGAAEITVFYSTERRRDRLTFAIRAQVGLFRTSLSENCLDLAEH